ncbi:YLP motif-containing protein 1 isoform X2 [Anoplophora glabripennis]|uniref:YLP motif-containing protein 1 isoform X2 n=1 Tax=Anoplophora glabripennis TaxID=217634 RepID=UPI000874F983|nr:YLP motif-containing protein 1 isoform X2 [Anoplophora glabripennis]
MSWPTWSASSAPIPTAMAAPVQSSLIQTPINTAPAVMPPGLAQYSPEQWAQAQQQNWQQWAQWQQQYQQWHQQYGAEYQKSISALQGLTTTQQPPLPTMPNTGVPPPLPAEPKPPLPPEDPPANQPSAIASYSTMPPKVGNAGYSTTAPPPVGAQQMQMPSQSAEQYNQRQAWQSNSNKRSYPQGFENEQNKRPLLDRSKQWGNQKSNLNQWTSQPPPNVSYNQPPPQTQPAPKPNIEELSEAEKKFDKEFAAWEAQFNKWKDQNANHPDKTQYLEYEKKWESWRNSLLERREQMRRKRLALSGASIGVHKPGYTQVSNVQQPVVDTTTRPPVAPVKPPIESPIRQQETTPDLTNNPPNLSNKPLPHQNNEPLNFKHSPQMPPDEIREDFLKPSFSSSGGIPGLDLVKDDGNEPQKEDIVDIDKEKTEKEGSTKGPDFDAISKGINSILGDQKLLSMLSMVSQNPPSAPGPNTATNSTSNIVPGYPLEHNFSAPPPPHQFTEAPPCGNFNAPPPTYQHNEGPHLTLPPCNDQSNQSYDERSSHGENYQQRESVNNFDDQTRSSFTMGTGDQDVGYGTNNFGRGQLNKPPPNRFLGVPPSENDRGVLKPGFGPGTVRTNDPGFNLTMPNKRNQFGPNDPGFNPNMMDNRNRLDPGEPGFNPNMSDNRNRLGPNSTFGGNMSDSRNKFGSKDPSFGISLSENRNKFGPLRPDNGAANFSKNPNLYNQGENFKRNDFNRGNNFHNESFNRGNLNTRQDNFSKENNFKYGGNSSNNLRSNNFGSGNNFDDRRGNFGNDFNRSGGFNEQNRYDEDFAKDTYDQGDYNDFENYNEDEDYEKYHEMFNDDDENPDLPRHSQQQGQGNQPAQRPQPPRLMDIPTEPPKPVPEEEPIFEPATVIDYEHKSQRTTEPDVVIEPIHMFDYRHKPLNRIPVPQRPKWLSESVKFIREFDPLASRGPLNLERSAPDRYPGNSREIRREERQSDILDDCFNTHNRLYEDRGRRFANEFESRSRRERRSFSKENDRFERNLKGTDDGYARREKRPFNKDEDIFDREPKGDVRNRYDDDRYNSKRNDSKQISSKEFEEFSDEEMNFESTELQKHQQSREMRGRSRSPILSNPPNPANFNEITMIEDIINSPGRFHRPPRIVIILRGPPGSGKTYLAKLIKDKEVENGGSAPRILSLDDYFMVEHEKEVIEDGKKVKVKEMVYEYEAEMEESYRQSFIKSFKKTITDGYFPFIIVDNINDKVKYFGEMWSFAKQNGFQVYICQLDLDPTLCTKRNIHNRNEAEIEECIAGWEPTPNHHPTIDASGFLQSAITDVEMEEVEQPVVETKVEEVPEPSSMESANLCDRPEPWKSTFKWKTTGNPLNQQNKARRGFGGPIWRNRGNRRR